MMRDRFATVEVSDPEFEVEGLRHVTAYSAALGRRADCTLWTPPGQHCHLPLVILLHGVYGSHWAWAYKAGAHRIARSLIDADQLDPVALAMPSDGLLDLGSGYVSGAGGDAASWIVHEVPALAQHVLQDAVAAGPVGLIGLSMGGFGALLLGARHSSEVHAVAALSAMTALDQMSLFVGDYSRLGVSADDHVVDTAIRRQRTSLPRIHFCCGTDDPLLEHNRALHRSLVRAGIEHEYCEDPGRHDWTYWRTHLPRALCLVMRHGGR